MIVERQGACRYCGQVMFIDVGAELEQSEIDGEVTGRCLCDGAKREKELHHALSNLELLTGETAVKLGYEYCVDEAAVAGLRTAVEQVLDGVYREVKVVEPGGDTICIREKIQGVSIRRTHKVDRKL